MKSEMTVSRFFSIALIGVCVVLGFLATEASAKEGGLMLHGQLVNAGCEAKLLSAPEQLLGLKSLTVNASLSFGLVNANDACEGSAVPVSMVYAERISGASGLHIGILILTYQ